MGLITYYPTIPNPPDAPSADVTRMQTNSGSGGSIWEVDHIGFNTNNSGTHQQIRCNQFSSGSLPMNPTTESSVTYPKSGTADPSRAQLYFKNSNPTDFIVSGIRCYGLCSVAGSPVILTTLQSINCTISRSSVGQYVVTITNNSVVDPNYGIFLQVINPLIEVCCAEKTGANQFTIRVFNLSGALRDPQQFCFQVFQL